MPDTLQEFEWETYGPGGYDIVSIPAPPINAPHWPEIHANDLSEEEWHRWTHVPWGVGHSIKLQSMRFIGDGERPILTPTSHGRAHRYQPFKDAPTLFQIFADTEPTPEGVRAFAEKYGPLGGPVEQLHNRYHAGRAVGPPIRGEAIYNSDVSWAEEILSVRDTLQTWQRAERGEIRGLEEERLTAQDGTSITRWFGAKESIRQGLNIRLQVLSVGQFEWNATNTKFQLSLSPHTLIGAIWIQLGFALSYQKSFPECRCCGRPFEISLDPTGSGLRKGTVFCSRKCKSQDYRNRQHQARTLHAQGMPLEDIAPTVRSTIKTVKRWLEQGASE